MIPGSDLQIMKTVLDYRKRARECRALARLISLREQRDQLLETARIWDSLAETREKLVRNRPRVCENLNQADRDELFVQVHASAPGISRPIEACKT
jgi:hypothetical protein